MRMSVMSGGFGRFVAAVLVAGVAACAPGGGDGDGGDETPDAGGVSDAGESADAGGTSTYAFTSRFDATKSSVAYTGQSFRHVLLATLEARIEGLTARIDTNNYVPTEGQVVSDLQFYYSFVQGTGDGVPHAIATAPLPPLQDALGLFASNAKLQDKTAGNDTSTDHKDFKTLFAGWPGFTSAESLTVDLFNRVEGLAIARANGEPARDPAGNAIAVAHVTADGLDLSELLGKFLSGAVFFSQGADDYLDDDVAGKGLLAANDAADGTNAYSPLEHQWDEGFGYFGLPRNTADFTLEELFTDTGRDAFRNGRHDADGDGKIDLRSEYTFGPARYAARADSTSNAAARTSFLTDAWEGFVAGRALITAAAGPLSETQLAELKTHRNRVVDAWEKAITAAAIRYLNDVLGHMKNAGTASYSFTEHAKHWSEMKGLLLASQFNPRSPLSDEAFATIHAALGTHPELPGSEGFDAYKVALRTVRSTLGTTYGFAAANLGDDDGAGGW